MVSADAGGANDEAALLGRLERIQDLPQALALGFILDLARDAHLAHARHHHEDAAGDGEIGRQGRALGADALLDDLDDDLIAPAKAALDRRAVAAGELAPDGLGDILALAAEIAGQQVGDVQEAVAAQAKIDKGGLDRRLDVDHPAFVDVADVGGGAGPLDVELFQFAVLHQGDSAFLALGDVNQHFFCHTSTD